MLVFLFAIGGINYEPRNTPNTLKMILFRVFRVFSGKKINPVNPVKKVRLSASLPQCLCVNFITETQRHRVFFILLCLSALIFFLAD